MKTTLKLSTIDLEKLLNGGTTEFEIFDSSGSIRKINVKADLESKQLETLISKLILNHGGQLVKTRAQEFINEVKKNGG